MLVLAVRTDAERVYAAGAAVLHPGRDRRGVRRARAASPARRSSARSMKQDGRDLLAQFRALAPERRPISLQRWSATPGRARGSRCVLGAVVVVPLVVNLLTPAHDLGIDGKPTCGTSNVMILMAQAVPAATSVPCIASLPAGWDLGGVGGRGRDKGRSGSTPTSGATTPSRRRCCPRDECRVAGRERGAERRGRDAALRAIRATSARPAQHALLPVPRRLRHLRVRVRRRATASLDLRRRQRARVPASAHAGGERARAERPQLCGAAAPPCPGGS